MKYLDKKSLFLTLDNISEAILLNQEVDYAEKLQISNFIINQQGKLTAYADTFAPTYNDLMGDLILFTGERIKSKAGKYHIIGEEACRVLRKLNLQIMLLFIMAEYSMWWYI